MLIGSFSSFCLHAVDLLAELPPLQLIHLPLSGEGCDPVIQPFISQYAQVDVRLFQSPWLLA
jgi:hypothetical protein